MFAHGRVLAAMGMNVLKCAGVLGLGSLTEAFLIQPRQYAFNRRKNSHVESQRLLLQQGPQVIIDHLTENLQATIHFVDVVWQSFDCIQNLFSDSRILSGSLG